jgi:phosphoglycerate dehydrogenase-like enzyme
MKQIRLMVADGATSNIAVRTRELVQAGPIDLILPDNKSEAVLLKSAPGADAIFCYKAEVTAAIIRAAPALKLIQKHGLNCRNIDIVAATELNVRVATVPLLRNVSVAEHAMALMLACARKVVPGHRAVSGAVYREMGLEPTQTAENNYRANWAAIKGVAEMYEATVGIVGMGDIGMEIAKRCRAFGMNLLYHQRAAHSAAVEAALGIRYVTLDELLSVSDYVVMIVPHTPQTEGMIGAKQLARMKPAATLVNVGRGGLIDEDALIEALQKRPEMSAGLDVYRREPLPSSSPLLALPNVVLLPHTGGGSYRSRDVDVPAALRNIERFFAGERLEGVINA